MKVDIDQQQYNKLISNIFSSSYLYLCFKYNIKPKHKYIQLNTTLWQSHQMQFSQVFLESKRTKFIKNIPLTTTFFATQILELLLHNSILYENLKQIDIDIINLWCMPTVAITPFSTYYSEKPKTIKPRGGFFNISDYLRFVYKRHNHLLNTLIKYEVEGR